MILVDTSVWIDYLNGKDTVEANILDTHLIKGTVVCGDMIMLEILQGFRRDRDYKKAKRTLASLEQYEMFGHNMVVKCADNYRVLRKKGITIRKTTDIIIATFCIEYELPLLFTDRDFMPFVRYLDLKSAQ